MTKNGVRLLCSSFDLQGFSLDLDTADFPSERFDAEISRMRDAHARKGFMYKIGAEYWELAPYKAGGYFRFDWDNSVSVWVNPNMRWSPVKGQVHSFGLHSLGGHVAVYEVVKEFLAAVGVKWGSAIRVYRQDVNWDFVVPANDLAPENVYAPGRSIRPVMDDELGVSTLAVGERGKDQAYLRNYNKVLEMEKRGSVWQKQVLKSQGWVEGENVLRVEFELGGNYLKEFGGNVWGADFEARVHKIIKKLARESFRLVRPFDRKKGMNGHKRVLDNLPVWDLLCADLEARRDGVAKRVKMPIHGDVRARARERHIEAELTYKVWCLEDGIAPELVASDLNFIDALTDDPNLIEEKRKRLGRSRKVYQLTNGKKIGGG